ncbi:ATP-binding cassette domain-containing protein [Moraxella cuniculi]|uniref:Lipid A export ATP-binding/permease protein MsbA n=1 Tax=Moraxella cuniculi TaxID=34061 RepID=A0A448GWY0_9GAMM|nr:ATP-binding cassette domain-containing protein [Moraxella cuniculi]VEG13277.1 Lipid A export ATP-binding/permease protein MsbA [Moraxella cuniculi]
MDNFNLDIQAGEQATLVGRSGSGKTTVINLLPRFVTLSNGQILLDGVDIYDIELTNLCQQFALVSQDVFCLMTLCLQICVILG